ncbi:MAG: iron complex transport system ATP-binding protein [Candidatus Marinamargulisbacteria bacterium]|jgi:iron complex transport system ATP-binding protein
MINVEALGFSYPNSAPILTDLSVDIKAGEILGIAGPNGAGKSTFFKLLLNLLKPTHGHIKLNNQPLNALSPKELATQIAWIGASIDCPFHYTVSQIVKMGRYPHRKTFSDLFYQPDDAIEEALSLTGLTPLKHRFFHQLSSGEQQLVYLARAFAQDPKLLLMDEAISHLDLKRQAQIKDILIAKNRTDNLSIVMISHHLNFLSQFANQLLLLDAGKRIAHGPPKQVLTQKTLEELYGKAIRTATGENGRPLVYI